MPASSTFRSLAVVVVVVRRRVNRNLIVKIDVLLIFVFLLHSAHAVFLDSHLYIVAIIIVIITIIAQVWATGIPFGRSGLLGFPLPAIHLSTRTRQRTCFDYYLIRTTRISKFPCCVRAWMCASVVFISLRFIYYDRTTAPRKVAFRRLRIPLPGQGPIP